MESKYSSLRTLDYGRLILKMLAVTLLTLGAISMIIPFLWSISTSIKSTENIFAHSAFWIQWPPDFSAYTKILKEVPIFQYALNTLKVACIVTFGQLLTSSMAGYAFAKLKFPGRDRLFVFYLATMMIPGTVLLIPNFIVMSKIGAVNTHWALILSAVGSVYSTFLMRQFFQTFPSELEDAAKLDGCTPISFYWRILLPNSKPILLTLGLMAFQGIWNDFQWPLIVLSRPEIRTLQVGLSYLTNEYYTDWNLLMAGSILTILPIIVLFFFVQKYFVQSFKLTGLKG